MTSQLVGCRYCGSTPLATERGRCEECGEYQDARGEFSVCQFFRDPDGQYEYVNRFVGAQEAMDTALALCSSVGARIGTTQRIIITDGGDCVAWEWQHGQGQTFPEVSP